MTENYTYHHSSSDPLFWDRQVTMESINRASDLITENHNLKWNYITIILTLIVSIIIGFFINSKNYLGIFGLLDILMILFIFLSYKYYKRRIELSNLKEKIWTTAGKLGIPRVEN